MIKSVTEALESACYSAYERGQARNEPRRQSNRNRPLTAAVIPATPAPLRSNVGRSELDDPLWGGCGRMMTIRYWDNERMRDGEAIWL